ncbi:MAG: hypothetical protein QF464_13730, partial [Myxococcota bacterium]|nr:hypothetical protein [Myxococcota bacterium]
HLYEESGLYSGTLNANADPSLTAITVPDGTTLDRLATDACGGVYVTGGQGGLAEVSGVGGATSNMLVEGAIWTATPNGTVSSLVARCGVDEGETTITAGFRQGGVARLNLDLGAEGAVVGQEDIMRRIGSAKRVDVVGDRAFVADTGGLSYAAEAGGAANALAVIDISTPEAPRADERCDLAGAVLDVAAAGGRLFALTVDSDALWSLDPADPCECALASCSVELPPTGAPRALAAGVVDTKTVIVVASDGSPRLQVYLANSDGSLSQTDTMQDGLDDADIYDVAIGEGYLVVVTAGGDDGDVLTLSVNGAGVLGSVTANTSWLGVPAAYYGPARAVDIAEGYAVVASVGGLSIRELNQPLGMAVWLDTSSIPQMGLATDVQVIENIAYVIGDDGIVAIDLGLTQENPGPPAVVETFSINADGQGLAIHGNHAYVAAGREVLRAVEIGCAPECDDLSVDCGGDCCCDYKSHELDLGDIMPAGTLIECCIRPGHSCGCTGDAVFETSLTGVDTTWQEVLSFETVSEKVGDTCPTEPPGVAWVDVCQTFTTETPAQFVKGTHDQCYADHFQCTFPDPICGN